MKLFTVGPVEMYPFTLKTAAGQIPYFRTKEFSAMMLESEGLLKKQMHAPDTSRLVFLTASGTGAMEATVFNLFNKDDRLLIIDGGSFGHRFAQICELHGIPHDVLTLSFGESLTSERLEEYSGTAYTGLLVNIHETSTGQLYDINMLSDFCRRKDMLLVADAISSFLADDVNAEKYSIDALITSSQKGLALGPGMSFVLLSERAIHDRIGRISPPSLYLDFSDHLKNQERGQTPFTPAVRVLYELNEMLRHIEYDEGGIENRLNTIRAEAEWFRSQVRGLPHVTIPEYPLSNALTPLIFSGVTAGEVYEAMRYKHEMTLTPNGGELGKKLLRVGHIGYHPHKDQEQLVLALKDVLNGGI